MIPIIVLDWQKSSWADYRIDNYIATKTSFILSNKHEILWQWREAKGINSPACYHWWQSSIFLWRGNETIQRLRSPRSRHPAADVSPYADILWRCEHWAQCPCCVMISICGCWLLSHGIDKKGLYIYNVNPLKTSEIDNSQIFLRGHFDMIVDECIMNLKCPWVLKG